jgi:hypothetical protein
MLICVLSANVNIKMCVTKLQLDLFLLVAIET